MIKPLRDLLVITMEKETEKTTDAGIFLTKDVWHDHKPYATIEAIGPDVNNMKVGEKVLINPYAVHDISGEEDIKFIKECDVIARV